MCIGGYLSMAQLYRIHQSDAPDAPNVVFIHGLGGHPRETWMHNSKDPKTLWPSWIGEDANCNVWVLGYDAASSAWKEPAMHLADQGVNLMATLLYEKGMLDRPMVLVGHSLGGLVIKSGIVHAETLGDSRFKPVLEKITCVVFIGTPHQGAVLATVAAAGAGLLRTNPQVINMASDDAWLKALNGQFRVLQSKQGFQVAVFFETHGYFVGRKFFGISFGPRITIVDRNSSDPQIHGVVPTPVDGDHLQIAKPLNRQAMIHKGLATIISKCRSKEEPISGEKKTLVDVDAVRQSLLKASTPLLTWPSTLPDGVWLERPELDQLEHDLDGSPSSLTLLLGEPGSGKSALLSRIAQLKQEAGWTVLAIKADRLPPDILDAEGLTRHLGIGSDVADVVTELAAAGPVLVVVDQLDALADLVVQHSARLCVILDLIRNLSDTPNVHILSSCRTFEHRHDPSLRNLDAGSVTISLPEWSLVQAVLEARGINAEHWNNEIKEVLRSPHALDTFLAMLHATTEVGILNSFQGILQLQWEKHVLADRTGRRKQALLDIARKMADREVLGLPLVVVEDWYKEIQELTAAGLLRTADGQGRVEFRHQTLYEFIRARCFLEDTGSLTDAVLRHQGSLRIRPQLWHALAYFRSASPEGYGEELVRLWAAGIRPHLKMLVTEFLGRQVSPLQSEVQLVFRSLDDIWFRPRFITAAIGSSGWLAELAQSHLPIWMTRPALEAQGLVPFLACGLNIDSRLVIELVRKLWLPDPARDDLSWRVLGLGNMAPNSPEWIDILETIASRTALAEWTIGHVAGVVSAQLPNEAPRLVAAWIRKRIRDEQSGAADADEAAEGIRKVLEGPNFHDLPAIAEAAPKRFTLAVWPILSEALSECIDAEHPLVVGFRRARGLHFDDMGDEDGRIDRPLVSAVWVGVQCWAQLEPAEFCDFVDRNGASEILLLERLLAKGLEHCASSNPGKALAYLAADPRRLALGPFTDVHKESVALIRALAPHLSQQQFADLEAFLSSWQPYKPAGTQDEDASVRQKRLRWARQHRLRLLRALPKDVCSVSMARKIEEEERAFPELGNEDVTFSGVYTVGSPVTADQMAKANDADILNVFDELDDESGWDHPRHRMKGGAIQAGRALAALAGKDLHKALRIIRALKAERNEIPAATALRALGSAGYPAADLFALIKELDEKGFASADFRRAVADSAAEVADAENPVPDWLMTRMESWLTSVSDEEDDETNDKSVQDSILWGRGMLRIVPNGNFPILAALTAGCFKRTPPEVDSWLGILERHATKSESLRVWRSMVWRYLSRLHIAERGRAEHFLNTLFASYPQLLETPDGASFLANSYRWASPAAVQRWLALMDASRRNEQGLGELLVLRLAMFPSDSWARDSIEAALETCDERTLARRVGISFAVAHLWPDPMLRPAIQPYLLRLIDSGDESVMSALDDIFVESNLGPDPETRQFLDALTVNKRLLTQPKAERLPDALELLVTSEPERVCRVAHALLDVAGEKMGNMATSWYLGTEPLLAVALRLQDLGADHRQSGSELFERMLEFNLPQAQELTLDLDKRTPVGGFGRPPRRRRRARTKKVRANQCDSAT